MGLYGLKEIMQVAQQLETNGQVYYETAAAKCKGATVSSLCTKLAEQEAKHLKGLQNLAHLLLADEQMKRLSWEELAWLQLELEEGVLPDARELKSFIEEATVADILARAIQMERDSVTFYSNLIPEVGQDYCALLEEFVKEEKLHVQWLQRQIDQQ